MNQFELIKRNIDVGNYGRLKIRSTAMGGKRHHKIHETKSFNFYCSQLQVELVTKQTLMPVKPDAASIGRWSCRVDTTLMDSTVRL